MTMAIQDFILLPVHDLETAKAYVDAMVKQNGCLFDFRRDPKECVPDPFEYDEALIVADRVERLREHMSVEQIVRYAAVCEARNEWAERSDDDIASQFRLFGQSPQTQSEALSDADMVALLERYDPSGDYEDLGSGELLELMNFYGTAP